MKIQHKIALLLFSILLIGNLVHAQFYNGLQNEFGKNRIQYQTYDWQFFRQDKFDVYFYNKGTELGKYAAESAFRQLEELETLFDFTLEDRFEIIVYPKQSEFVQTNVGAGSTDNNVGGATKIVGSKLFVYYDEDHKNIDAQIRYGISEVILNQWLYGGNWRDKLRSSTVMNLPDWYIKGLLNYVAYGWNAKIDNQVRDAFAHKRFKHLNNLSADDAAIAGHSIWNFIVENYGKEVIPNLIYMSSMSRNVESGFMFVFGLSGSNLLQSWRNYYQELYQSRKALSNSIQPNYTKIKGIRRFKKETNLTSFEVSPDGKYYAYATNYQGRYKVYLYEIATHKLIRVYKGGLKLERTNDYSFPLLTWHPSSQRFAIITEERGEVVLSYYLLDMKEIESRPPLFYFDKVLSLHYMPDGKRFIMSAVKGNQSDIFIYNIVSNKIDNITNDIYDDLNPICIDKGKTIVFSSNRTTDSIKTVLPYKRSFSKKDFDLYACPSTGKPIVLNRLTSTPSLNETNLAAIDTSKFVFLVEQANVKNRYVGRIDSTLAAVDTIAHFSYLVRSSQVSNYSNGIMGQSFSPRSSQFAEWFLANKRVRIALHEIPAEFTTISNKKVDDSKLSTESIQDTQVVLSNIKNVRYVPTKKYKTATTLKSASSIDYRNYVFEGETSASKPTSSPISNGNNESTKAGTFTSELDKALFSLPKQLNYFKFFTTDQIISQFNNNFSNNAYQKYTGGEFFYTPALNGMFKLGMSDLFEDYRIVGGFRLSLDMKSNEFLVSVEDRHKRWDKQFTFYRQSIPQTLANGPKILSHSLTYTLKYPFSEVLSFRTNVASRIDRSVFQASDTETLQKKTQNDYWFLSKSELVFDNSKTTLMNIHNGFKAKLFFEYYNGIVKYKDNLGVVGLDARYYQKIYKNIIWANRIAYSTSFGSKRLIYYLGSVDNWWNLNRANNPTFNSSTKIKNDSIYAFQSIATNMRGFQQNIKNGNNFAVWNTELRVPIFNTLLRKPASSEFINNFQFIYYFDLGSAWVGLTPYSNSDEMVTVVPDKKKITESIVVSLIGTKSPIVYGYGWGLRSKVLGYFVRLDFANGVEDGSTKTKMFYLSLSTDF